MAFDISALTNKVNQYLYSISDTNQLLSESNSAGTSSYLSGIFEKYLDKAVSDEAGAAEVVKALQETVVNNQISELSSLATGLNSTNNTNNIDSILSNTSGYNDLDDFLYLTLPSMAKQNGSTFSATAGEAATANVSATKGGTSQVVSPQLDSMASEIRSRAAFPGEELSQKISKAFNSLNIGQEIKQSMAEHNRIDEIESFAAERIKAYKSQPAADTSVFGDFKL